MWIVCGMLSLVFCMLSWIMVSKKGTMALWASVCSLAFVAITLLMEYRVVLNWVNKKDWSALADVVPGMYSILTGYVVIMLLANAFTLASFHKK